MRLPMCLCEMGVGLQAINLCFNSSSESSVSHRHYKHDTQPLEMHILQKSTAKGVNAFIYMKTVLQRNVKGKLTYYLQFGNKEAFLTTSVIPTTVHIKIFGKTRF